MSHDFAFWESTEPLENEEADGIFASLMESGASERIAPSARIALFAQEIRSRWPEPDPGHEDAWPFASPCDVSESHLTVFIVPSRVWDVWPVLGLLAKQLDLVMYDPQQRHVFLPPRLSQKRTRARAQRNRSRGKS